MRCRTRLLLSLIIGLIIGMSGIAGCGGDVHDYSGLLPGDIARPEFEYALDYDFWFSAMGLDKLIPPEGWKALDATGLTSFEQTNVIAFERGGRVYIEGTYELPEGKTSIIKPVLEVTPPESKLLGHLNNEGVMMSFYVSGMQGFLKAIGSIITDPAAVDLIFEGNKETAAQVKLGFTTARSQIEGMLLDLFKDECMMVCYPKPGFDLTKGSIPLEAVLIAPSASGRAVAPDVVELIKSFASMAGAFIKEPGLGEKLEPKKGEIAGYECYSWDFDGGVNLAMVDAGGYLFVSDSSGIEKILAAFDTKEAKYEAMKPANMYFYMDYDLYFNQYLIPMLDAMEKGGILEEVKAKSPEMGMQMEENLSFAREMMDSIKGIGSSGWADFSFRFTGNGFEISERLNAEIAEAGLVWKDKAPELFRKMLVNFQKGLGLVPFNEVSQEAPPTDESEAPETPPPPGGVF